MSTLHEGQKIGDYTVQSLIKKNLYTETYRVEDEKQQVFFSETFCNETSASKNGE